MGVKIRLDARALNKLDGSVLKAAEMTMEALRTDVLSDQVMPYNVGTMQNDDTFTDVQRNTTFRRRTTRTLAANGWSRGSMETKRTLFQTHFKRF